MYDMLCFLHLNNYKAFFYFVAIIILYSTFFPYKMGTVNHNPVLK